MITPHTPIFETTIDTLLCTTPASSKETGKRAEGPPDPCVSEALQTRPPEASLGGARKHGRGEARHWPAARRTRGTFRQQRRKPVTTLQAPVNPQQRPRPRPRETTGQPRGPRASAARGQRGRAAAAAAQNGCVLRKPRLPTLTVTCRITYTSYDITCF